MRSYCFYHIEKQRDTTFFLKLEIQSNFNKNPFSVNIPAVIGGKRCGWKLAYVRNYFNRFYAEILQKLNDNVDGQL